VDIVILAGGKCSPELEAFAGTPWRALLPWGESTILDQVVQALEPLGEIILVGGPESSNARRVPSGATFVESIGNGLAEVRSENFLLATSDTPYLTSDSVSDFLSRTDPAALFNFPIIPVQAGRELKRTSIRLREGRFTGGNLALVHRDLVRQSLPILEQAYAARKKPLQLASMVGLGTLAQLVVGQIVPSLLPLRTLERAVGRFLRAPVKAIPTEYSEIGDDIDTLEQYQTALRSLRA